MAYTNRNIAAPQIAYPELHPVTPRHFQKPLQSRNRKTLSRGERLLLMMINGALVFGMAQCLRTLVSDSLNLSRLFNTQASVQKYYGETRQQHQLLSEKIRIYSSPSGIEELARNYLNMVGSNELPVRFQ